MRVVQAGGGGDLLAEIAREINDRDVRVAVAQALHDLQRAIVAAVIDENQFPWLAQALHHRGGARVQQRKVPLLVKGGNHDGEYGQSAAGPGHRNRLGGKQTLCSAAETLTDR